MFDSYFDPSAQLAIALACLLSVLGLVLWHRSQERTALGLVLLAALTLRLMAIQLDPFLNIWDECVHAVVARNMVEHPFTPMLFTDTELGLDHKEWTLNNVWLHKQPFFLWMISLSLRVLGYSVFALRLPSALFTTALVFFTYRLARSMHDKDTAFHAAFLMAWSHWFLILCLGGVLSDHNNAVFISLVGGSFWAWSEWDRSRKLRWAVVAGCFVGSALLTKWLPGALLFGGWSLIFLLGTGDRRQELKALLIALAVAVLLAAPWQISAWVRFPVEMAHEMSFNSLHLWEAVEGHVGDHWFYYHSLVEQFQPFPSLLMFGALLLSVTQCRERRMRIMAITSVVVTYMVYTLAATKMHAYPMLVIGFFFIGLAHLLALVTRPYSLSRTWLVLAVAVSAGALFQLERLQRTHTAQAKLDPFYSVYRSAHLQNLRVMDRLASEIDGTQGHAIIYNVPFPANLTMMFFHGHQVIPGTPDPERTALLIQKGRRIIVVNPSDELRALLPSRVQYLETGNESFVQPPL
ncbi:MAG: glycosyltransferase family 39 protein [Flavobacteriales bacterium]